MTTQAGSLAPKFVKELVIPVHEVSTDKDSGWRDIDPRRVQELVTSFRQGDYGINILRKPSILYENNAPALAGDGCYKLSDGKATFAALKVLKEIYERELSAWGAF